jgi:hypothetical protein
LAWPVFSGTRKEKKREKEKEQIKNRRVDQKKKEEKRADANVYVVWLLSSSCYVYGFFFTKISLYLKERKEERAELLNPSFDDSERAQAFSSPRFFFQSKEHET